MSEAAIKLLQNGKVGDEDEMDPVEQRAALATLSENLRQRQASPNHSPAKSHLSRIGQSVLESPSVLPDVIRIGQISPTAKHQDLQSTMTNYSGQASSDRASQAKIEHFKDYIRKMIQQSANRDLFDMDEEEELRQILANS